MQRNVSLKTLVVSVLGLVVLIAAGVFAYIYISGGSGEATREVEAAAIPTQQPAADTEATAEVATASDTTFTIVSEESEVSFTLQEDLAGVRTTVVGVTNQIGGNIAVNFDNPQESQVGAIEINVRTLATDNEFRNRAIRDRILGSNQSQYEFTTFTPTAIAGLPETVAVGDTFTFTLTGNLPIRDITQEVTWDVTVTVVSETRIEGTATTQVLRSQYELQIPSVPSVANVTDEVDLKIEFVATAS